MKRFKFTIISLLLIFACTSCFALEVQDILKELAKDKITKGDFAQTKTMTTTKGKREIKSSGTFIICDSGIAWQTLKPFPSTMAVTDSAMIQIASDGRKQVMDGSNNPTYTGIANSFASIFSNDLETLQNNFNIEFSADSSKNWKISLTPKDSTISTVMSTISMCGNFIEKKCVLSSMEMIESTGNSVMYQFSNNTHPLELSNEEKSIFSTK